MILSNGDSFWLRTPPKQLQGVMYREGLMASGHVTSGLSAAIMNISGYTADKTATLCVSSSCLRSWLEQDTSCPTCRTSLNINGDGGQERSPQQGAGVEENIGPVGAAADARPHSNQQNHFFHFDGQSGGSKDTFDTLSATNCKY